MATATATAEGRLVGTELHPPALEEAYRLDCLRSDGQVVAAVMLTITASSLPFIASDWQFSAGGATFWWLLSARLAFVAATVIGAWVSLRAPRRGTVDATALVWLLLYSVMEVVLQSTRPPTYDLPLASTALALIMAWVVMPNRFVLQAVAGLAVTGSGVAWMLLFREPLGVAEARFVWICALGLNTLCTIATVNVHRTRRRQFLAVRTAEEAVARLKERDAELALSQGRFRTMANAAPVLIWLAGPDKGCTWVNEQSLKFTGRTLEQEVGSNWTEGIHPEDRAGSVETYTQAFDRREPYSMEYRLRRHDGVYRWLLTTGRPLTLENGAFAGYIGTSIDITERKEAEARSRQAEQQLRAAIEASQAGFLDIDLVTGTAYRSPRYWEIVGWPKGAFPNQAYAMEPVIHPDDAPEALGLRDALVKGTIDQCDCELRVRTQAGSWVWVRTQLKVVGHDATGRPTRIAGVVSDVQASREQRTHALETARLHGLSGRMNEAELVVALDGTVVEANDRALELYGRPREELIGQHVQLVRAPESLPTVDEVLRTASETGARYETVHCHRDGSPFPVGVSCRLVKVAGESYLHFLVRDLTDERKKEAELQLLADITRNMQDLVVVADTQFRIVRIGNATGAILGWSEAEVLGKTVREVFKSEYPEGGGDAHEARLREGKASRVYVRLTGRDGQRVDCDASVSPRRDAAGQLIGYVAVTRDITAEKTAERALMANEERLRTIISAMAEGVLVQDATGTVVTCNAAAEAILGMSRAQLEGVTSLDPRWRIMKADGTPLPRPEHPSVVTLRTGQPVRNAVVGVRKPDGALTWVSTSTVPLRLEPNAPLYGVVATFTDITELRKTSDELSARLEELREALANVKTLTGLIPICMHCKKIRDDAGFWERIESYIAAHSTAMFSHGVCPDCLAKHYPEGR